MESTNKKIKSNGNKNIISYNNCNFVVKELNKIDVIEPKISKVEDIPELKPDIIQVGNLIKINASILKKVLGKNNYKKFSKQIRDGSTPQETYNRFGIIELKILATVILNNMELDIENKNKLNNVINDQKIQNNKSNIKNLMDSIISDIYNKKISN
jgi:glycerol-3-phosphate cytidylyltransferase-like family protein